MSEQSPLQKRREVEQRRIKRLQLKSAILDAKQSLSLEHDAKIRLAAVANDLASKVDRLVALSDELENNKIRYETHFEMRRRDADSRMSHLSMSDDGTPTTKSMMLFNTPAEKPHRQGPPGRSTRRTAFAIDYSGKKYPGVCEFQDANDKRQRAEKIIQGRTALRRSKDYSAPINTNTLPKLSHQKKPAGHAEGGLFSVDTAKGRSSKRTRFYTDYEGRRIQMDPGSWPTENGAVLL